MPSPSAALWGAPGAAAVAAARLAPRDASRTGTRRPSRKLCGGPGLCNQRCVRAALLALRWPPAPHTVDGSPCACMIVDGEA